MAGTNITLAAGVGVTLSVIYILLSLFRNKRKTELQNKVVLITGASSGLGEACAHVFYKAGAKVILAARRLEQLERVKTDLQNLIVTVPTNCPEILQLDLEDLQSIPAAAQRLVDIHGGVDILINNGGISYRGEITQTSVDVDIQVMKVNYFGHVALTKALLPSMISRRTGHIVAVSSVQGKIAIPFRSAYAASKHAAQAFFDSLRAEVAHHNIHVSVVSPGYINTNLSLNAMTGDGSKYGVMDVTTASGMSPVYVAEEILAAVTLQREDVLLAPLIHRLVVYIRNIIPSLFMRVMKSRAIKQKDEVEKNK